MITTDLKKYTQKPFLCTEKSVYCKHTCNESLRAVVKFVNKQFLKPQFNFNVLSNNKLLHVVISRPLHMQQTERTMKMLEFSLKRAEGLREEAEPPLVL